jgi:hypothetical protein
MSGEPVGHAVRDFHEAYASLSVAIANTIQKMNFGQRVPEEELVSAWTERNDVGGYLVVGDPAVRLRVADLM